MIRSSTLLLQPDVFTVLHCKDLTLLQSWQDDVRSEEEKEIVLVFTDWPPWLAVITVMAVFPTLTFLPACSHFRHLLPLPSVCLGPLPVSASQQ